MAFINELVPQEDIKKYGLDELHQHYSKLAGDRYGVRTGLKNGYPWMVDRERGIWFMVLGIGTVDDIPPMATGKDYYILHYKGKNIEVVMYENNKEGSTKLSDSPFRMRWEILSIKPEEFDDVSTQEIVDVITEAMIARGYAGLRRQLPNTDVKVKYVGRAN